MLSLGTSTVSPPGASRCTLAQHGPSMGQCCMTVKPTMACINMMNCLLAGDFLTPDEVTFAVLLRGYGNKSPADWTRIDGTLTTMRLKYNIEPTSGESLRHCKHHLCGMWLVQPSRRLACVMYMDHLFASLPRSRGKGILQTLTC